jgi:predicted RNA-binding Zn-ribbon protein involved in translation (DUF1610 family)
MSEEEEEESYHSKYPCPNCGAYRFHEYADDTGAGMVCDYCGYEA